MDKQKRKKLKNIILWVPTTRAEQFGKQLSPRLWHAMRALFYHNLPVKSRCGNLFVPVHI